MIYTIGLAAKYAPAIAAGRGIKLGKHLGRDGAEIHGGWVWQTPGEAQAYLIAHDSGDRRVYGVLADWDIDTYVAEGEPTRCLARDAILISLG